MGKKPEQAGAFRAGTLTNPYEGGKDCGRLHLVEIWYLLVECSTTVQAAVVGDPALVRMIRKAADKGLLCLQLLYLGTPPRSAPIAAVDKTGEL